MSTALDQCSRALKSTSMATPYVAGIAALIGHYGGREGHGTAIARRLGQKRASGSWSGVLRAAGRSLRAAGRNAVGCFRHKRTGPGYLGSVLAIPSLGQQKITRGRPLSGSALGGRRADGRHRGPGCDLRRRDRTETRASRTTGMYCPWTPTALPSTAARDERFAHGDKLRAERRDGRQTGGSGEVASRSRADEGLAACSKLGSGLRPATEEPTPLPSPRLAHGCPMRAATGSADASQVVQCGVGLIGPGEAWRLHACTSERLRAAT